MAGRRLREAVKMVLTSGRNGEFNSNVHVVIAGLTNAYSQYVTTFEEYQVQRYEVCCFKFSKTIFTSDIEDKRKRKKKTSCACFVSSTAWFQTFN